MPQIFDGVPLLEVISESIREDGYVEATYRYDFYGGPSIETRTYSKDEWSKIKESRKLRIIGF